MDIILILLETLPILIGLTLGIFGIKGIKKLFKKKKPKKPTGNYWD